jgi:hypothetical protein
MGRFIRLSLIFLLVLSAASVWGWRHSSAQSGMGEYFKQTGHNVLGLFLVKYRSVSNPLQLYGYPITEEFPDKNTGNKVQYFQKARFELVGDQVQISPLGTFMYQPGQPQASFGESAACRVVAPTAFTVCYTFLDFFDQYGGANQFGLPISNAEQHDDRIVQYFERARFEWRPDRPSGQYVVLTDLGAQYFYSHGENQANRLPAPDANIYTRPGETPVEEGILSLRVRAYPKKAVASQQGVQSVYVIVQDQRLLPVEGAQVTLLVTLPGGDQYRYIVPVLTNERGIVQFQFPYKADTTGPVQIFVTANYQNLKSQTTTSFRSWW